MAEYLRQHPGLCWLGVMAIMAALLGIANVTSMDGGVGSTLFVLFAIFGAPFLIAASIGVGLTIWAPLFVQVIAAGILAIGAALLLDDPLQQILERLGETWRAR